MRFPVTSLPEMPTCFALVLRFGCGALVPVPVHIVWFLAPVRNYYRSESVGLAGQSP